MMKIPIAAILNSLRVNKAIMIIDKAQNKMKKIENHSKKVINTIAYGERKTQFNTVANDYGLIQIKPSDVYKPSCQARENHNSI